MNNKPPDPLDLPGIAALLNSKRQPDWWAPNDYDDHLYSAREVRVLIKLSHMENNTRLTEELREYVREKIAVAVEQERFKYERQFDELNARLDVPKSGPSPQSPTLQKRALPDPASIVRIQAQLFENFRKPPERRSKTQAHVQLKLYVWTCPVEDIEKHPMGNQGYWLVPLHRPDRAEGRKRIPEIMSRVDELGRDWVQYAGCVMGGGKVVEQSAYVGHNNRLMMEINDRVIEFGTPMSKPDDAKENAHALRWFYP
jgi:hypothetical protein